MNESFTGEISQSLSSSELFLLISFIFVIVLQLSSSLLNKDKAEFWSPMTMISLVYVYYCLVGPIQLVIDGDYMFRNIDHRPYLFSAWMGAFLSYSATWIGFTIFNKTYRPSKILSLKNVEFVRKAQILFVISMVLFIIYAGSGFMSKMSAVSSSSDEIAVEDGYSGSLSGYLLQSVVFFISASMLAFIAFLQKKGILWFLIIFGITFSIFINGGFRWRIVVLCFCLMSVYHLYNKIKLKWSLALGLLIPLVLLMGLMELTRGYGKGLNLKNVETIETSTMLENSVTEAACFIASGLVIDEYESVFTFSHFDFIVNAISAPIPRALWPGKPDGSYMLDVVRELYGGGNKGIGQAVLNFAEYYMAFGWYGVILFPLFVGMFLKRFWLWFKANRDNEYAIILISVINAMLYVWVSRGYLSQFLTLFIIACLPVWIMYNQYKTKNLKYK